MTDYLSIIKQPIERELGQFVNPIERELGQFVNLFNSSLTHEGMLQEEIFSRIRNRAGKRMRPMLIMLMAKNYGRITDATLHAAVGLELLHTASLVHDDVVDESRERRGQASVNAVYDNKVALGDAQRGHSKVSGRAWTHAVRRRDTATYQHRRQRNIGGNVL